MDTPSRSWLGKALSPFSASGSRHGEEIYSARVTLSPRALAFKSPYGFLWFWIGDHEAYENLIAWAFSKRFSVSAESPA
jgi:hypothetical protein